MSDAHRTSIEFEATLDKRGTIAVPHHVVEALKRNSGKVHVRLTAKAISSDMERRGVNEEEIERISRIQLEPREQVIKFLLSEGALSKKSAGRKAR